MNEFLKKISDEERCFREHEENRDSRDREYEALWSDLRMYFLGRLENADEHVIAKQFVALVEELKRRTFYHFVEELAESFDKHGTTKFGNLFSGKLMMVLVGLVIEASAGKSPAKAVAGILKDFQSILPITARDFSELAGAVCNLRSYIQQRLAGMEQERIEEEKRIIREDAANEPALRRNLSFAISKENGFSNEEIANRWNRLHPTEHIGEIKQAEYTVKKGIQKAKAFCSRHHKSLQEVAEILEIKNALLEPPLESKPRPTANIEHLKNRAKRITRKSNRADKK